MSGQWQLCGLQSQASLGPSVVFVDVGRGLLGRAGLKGVFVTVGRPMGKTENSLSIHTRVTTRAFHPRLFTPQVHG